MVKFADQWASLGTMIQEQVSKLILRRDFGINPGALEKAAEKLGGFHSELDELFEEAAEDMGL
jgi:hypothetical protein